MAVSAKFRPNYFFVCDAILAGATVGAMHHETPLAARSEIKTKRRRREPIWTPPSRQVSLIREDREHQLARYIEQPAADDRARIRIEVDDAIFCVHSSSPSLAGFLDS